MANSKKIIVAGRVGTEPETTFLQDGTAVTKFSIAADDGFGDKKHTDWFRVTFWGKRGQTLAEYVRTGHTLLVFGQFSSREWTDNSGATKTSLEIRGDDFDLIHGKEEGSAPRQESRQQAPRPAPAQAAPAFGDDGF